MSKYTAEQVIYAADLEQARYDGDLIISGYLRDYAALLRERESAKAGVTEDIVRKLGDEYFRLCKEADRKPMQAGFWMIQFRTALEAVAPMLASARVSDGWQLVPIEPTQEMLEMAHALDPLGCDVEYAADVYPAIWKAMLAAAPKPETEE